MWPAAALPADLELQLAVPTTVYHRLQPFHDLQWKGKPDRRIGATHWQDWLRGHVLRDTVRGPDPAPATRALDASAPGRGLALHMVPLANLPFDPAPKGAIRKSVEILPARGATEPTKCPLCKDKFYTRGAMLEHLAWHAVHASAPGEEKEAASHILQGRARSPPGTPRTPSAPPPSPGGRPRGGTGGGRGGSRRGPRGRQCSPPGVHPRGDGPLLGPPWERAPHTP